MGNAEFVLLPSICYEGCSMTVIEAFSLGKPVIATDIGGTIYNMAASIKGTAFAALLSSVLCEIIQYFTHRGVADINDVLFNLIGACAGALLFRAFRAFKKKKDLQ